MTGIRRAAPLVLSKPPASVSELHSRASKNTLGANPIMCELQFFRQWRHIPVQENEPQAPSSFSPADDAYLLELLQEVRWKLSIVQTRMQIQGWHKSHTRLNQKIVDALQSIGEAIDYTSDAPDE